MKRKKWNIVTTSGASDFRRSAVVGGFDVKVGFNEAKPLQSTLCNRENTQVANQAPPSFQILELKSTI